jgi:hypothetical protein
MIAKIKSWYRFINPKFQTVHLDYPVEVKPRYTLDNGGHPKLKEIITRHESTYEEIITLLISHVDQFKSWQTVSNSQDDTQPKWNNGYVPALDMMLLYALMVHHKPRYVIEVGSGNSTKVIRAAIGDHKIESSITSIDPHPRATIDDLSDQIIRKRLEDCDINEICDTLNAGDILFIDNSHRVLPNSDAMVVFTEILHRLNTGVIVHIHDIYIPYDYPQSMCDRYYSEQYALMAIILSNPDRYKTIMPAYYVSQEKNYQDQMASIWSLPHLTSGEKHGGSYWIQIT